MAAVVTRQTGSATVGDSLKCKVKFQQQIILEEIKKTGKNCEYISMAVMVSVPLSDLIIKGLSRQWSML